MLPVGIERIGAQIWIEIGFLLLLYGYIFLTVYGIGHLFLRFLILPLSRIESILLAFLLGLGAFSIGIAIIGMAGCLTTLGILAWLVISGSIAFRELLEVVYDSEKRNDGSASPRSRFEVLLQTIIFASIPLLLVSVVSPVWDYDALLYHLEVPRQFLT